MPRSTARTGSASAASGVGTHCCASEGVDCDFIMCSRCSTPNEPALASGVSEALEGGLGAVRLGGGGEAAAANLLPTPFDLMSAMLGRLKPGTPTRRESNALPLPRDAAIFSPQI